MTAIPDGAPDLLADQLLPGETVRATHVEDGEDGTTSVVVTDGRLLVAERAGESRTVEATDLHSETVVGTTVLRDAETGDQSRTNLSVITGFVGLLIAGYGVIGAWNVGLLLLALTVGLATVAVSAVIFVHSRPSEVPAGVVLRYPDAERRWIFDSEGQAVCEAAARVVAERER